MDKSAMLTQPVSAQDHAEGPADAPLTLVEYGDYQCPYWKMVFKSDFSPLVESLQQPGS